MLIGFCRSGEEPNRMRSIYKLNTESLAQPPSCHNLLHKIETQRFCNSTSKRILEPQQPRMRTCRFLGLCNSKDHGIQVSNRARLQSSLQRLLSVLPRPKTRFQGLKDLGSCNTQLIGITHRAQGCRSPVLQNSLGISKEQSEI